MHLLYGINERTALEDYPIAGFVIIALYGLVLTYILLEKLILLHIFAYSKLHKMAFNAWQRFDMWYYRKYRKHSPLTENMAKIQSRVGPKMSKRKRRILLISVILIFILFNVLVRVPYMIETINDQERVIIDQETENTENTENTNDELKIIVRGG